MEDPALMARTKLGDEEAYAEIVERYQHPLVNYLTHLTRSRDRAEDVAQEAFVRLYRHADRYEFEGSVGPFLFKIATNLIRSENRRCRAWEMIRLRFPSPLQTESPHTHLLNDEIQNQVSSALASLPLAYRAAVVLREIEEWSYEEIARALDCTTGTVKSKINRGRRLLRAKLERYWNGGTKHERRGTAVTAAVTAAAERID